MNTAAGIWIDHRKAVIVIVSDQGERTRQIESDVEKHVRFSGGSRSEQGVAEDQQGSPITGHLTRY